MEKGEKTGRPKQAEVREQLKKITTSKTFENHAKLGDLLRAFVLAALRGKKVDEDRVGVSLFGKPEGWVPMQESAVRERKRLMRKQLMAYYDGEGREDRVIMELPKYGQLRFDYNPHAQAAELVRAALKLMDETFPEVMERYGRRVLNTLEMCIKLYPNYAPAYAALAQVLLIYTACDESSCFPARASISKAEKAAQKAIELDKRLWRGHIVAGALHCCRFNWDAAEKAFESAMKIDPTETSISFFYIVYLEALGNHREADKCLMSRIDVLGNTRFAWPIEALFDYIRGEGFGKGYAVLLERSASGPSIEIDNRYQRGEIILQFDFWAISILAACVCSKMGATEIALRYAEQGVSESKVGAFAGVIVLAHAACGQKNRKFARTAQRLLKELEGQKRIVAFSLPDESENQVSASAFSLALAYVGVGKTDLAVEKLREACDEGFPLVIFLHCWPAFDPLRNHDGFKKLIERMKLRR